MKTLKNKTILIGRDPEKQRLLAAVAVGGKIKQVAVDGSIIPLSISRIQASANTGHCKIDIDANGEATITNLKDMNITVVDGVSVVSKRITANSKITLGKDDYVLDIEELITAVKRAVGIDIAHLERVWNDYEAELEAIAKASQKRSQRRMLPMLISVASGLVTALLSQFGGGVAAYIPIPIMVVSLAIYIRNYREKDTSIEDKKQATEKFEEEYICPACKRFMGTTKYKLLLQKGKCAQCGAEFLKE